MIDQQGQQDQTIRIQKLADHLNKSLFDPINYFFSFPSPLLSSLLSLLSFLFSLLLIFSFPSHPLSSFLLSSPSSPLLSLTLLPTSRQLSDSCQKVLFSATYSDEVMSFAKQVTPDPIIIRLKRNEESLDNIKQVCVLCGDMCVCVWVGGRGVKGSEERRERKSTYTHKREREREGRK